MALLSEKECVFLPIERLRGGDTQAALARCEREEERALFRANLAYCRGEAEKAREIAGPVYDAAAELSLKIGAGLMLGLSAMWAGDVRLWKKVVAELSALQVSPETQPVKEVALALFSAVMHGRKGYPQWLETGAFAGLPAALFPCARWIYVDLFYIKWQEVELLAVAEPMIAECRREQSALWEIYLRLLAATAYCDHKKLKQANAHIDEAIALAKPWGCIAPFIEQGRLMMRLVNDRLKSGWPEALPMIKKRAQAFYANWDSMYNKIWEDKVADNLTPREYEACALAARGLTVREIASRMSISVSSVKKYLNTAYGKLDVKKKEQLSKHAHP